LDLLGKILRQVIHLAGEIFLEGNRCGLDRSCQQAYAQAAGHGTEQNAFKRIAAVDWVHWLTPFAVTPL
jgi:hypothetical protein